jgi:hypothetical protein
VRSTAAPALGLRLAKAAAVVTGLLGITVGLLTPAVVSPQKLPWRAHINVNVAKPSTEPVPVSYQTTMVVQEVKRKVYPYSIVPGGAEDLAQAKRFMSDPAVKANYADIDFAQLKQVKLTTNLSGYVSYRWGEKFYWTRKALTLKAGETVFTDGVHIVRGRCLNCYSASPMGPIRPTEPTERAFDLPTEMPTVVYSFPKLPVMAAELPIPPGELTPSVPVLPAVVGSTLGKTPGGGFWFPLIPIIPPIHHHPSSPSSPNTPGGPGSPIVPPATPPVTPPVVVPEPNYGWGLALGFLAMILVYRLRRRTAA